MTGCPNNCARPPSAEIGIYGYGKNDHVVLVGGSREGTRIGKQRAVQASTPRRREGRSPPSHRTRAWWSVSARCW